MDISIIQGNKENYRNVIMGIQLRIERAKVANENRKQLIYEKSQAEDLYDSINTYYKKLYELKNRLIKESDDFKTRRITHLNDVITEGISRIFPDRGLRAEVICDYKRKSVTRLRLVDKDGNELNPYISNGKLMQYLISFSAVCGISKSLNVHNLFIDEAFGVASQNNLPIIGDIIAKEIRENGMQIILVSQNPALYLDVPRRQFELELVDNKSHAEVKSVKDY